MAKKEKKEKVRYYDDGRTLADMSNVSGGSRLHDHNPYRPKGFYKEVWKTYWNAVKMMIGPMLIFIAILLAAYLITWFIFAFLL
jgi:hypothetical protein